jgi:hypothetical protein
MVWMLVVQTVLIVHFVVGWGAQVGKGSSWVGWPREKVGFPSWAAAWATRAPKATAVVFMVGGCLVRDAASD